MTLMLASKTRVADASPHVHLGRVVVDHIESTSFKKPRQRRVTNVGFHEKNRARGWRFFRFPVDKVIHHRHPVTARHVGINNMRPNKPRPPRHQNFHQ